MKFQVGQHVAIRGVVESVEDVGEGREVVTIRHAHSGKKFGAWAELFENVGPELLPSPGPAQLGPGNNPTQGTTIHISAGTPVPA